MAFFTRYFPHNIFPLITKPQKKGFTLIELLMVISIIALITAVVVFNQSDFADNISLTNTANEIELQIREAQVYGISVREFVPTSNEFYIAYGASFNLNNAGSSNNSFIYFADRNPLNGVYNTPTTCVADGTTECLSRVRLQRGNIISNICVIQSTGSEVCAPTLGRFDVTFLRPNPNAKIIFYNGSGGQVTYPNHRGVRIELRSPKNRTISVYVYSTGQVSIQ